MVLQASPSSRVEASRRANVFRRFAILPIFMPARDLMAARRLLADGCRVFVLTGAGLSAEAGLPTYRGRGGLWRRVDPAKFTSPDAFSRDPRTFWQLCGAMRDEIERADPSAAHLALARAALAARGAWTLATQNVDGLHDRAAGTAAGGADAGAARAAELHGNLWHLRCLGCGHRYEHRQAIEPEAPPRCPRCAGRTRPDIVWFGEEPIREALAAAVAAARTCDVCLVIGTSALVAPASRLPAVAVSHGARVIEINPEPTPLTEAATVSLRRRAGEALAALL
jgi:NAD-dependent deacetylase